MPLRPPGLPLVWEGVHEGRWLKVRYEEHLPPKGSKGGKASLGVSRELWTFPGVLIWTPRPKAGAIFP